MNSGRVALGNVGAELGSVILYILYQSFRPATEPNASEMLLPNSSLRPNSPGFNLFER